MGHTYTEKMFSFIWNSNLIEHPVFSLPALAFSVYQDDDNSFSSSKSHRKCLCGQIKTQWGITSNSLGWWLSKEQKRASTGDYVEKLEPLCPVGNIKWHSCYKEKVFLKILKIELPWSNNPTLGHIFKNLKSRVSKRHWHIHVHCSTTHNSQEEEVTQVSIEG